MDLFHALKEIGIIPFDSRTDRYTITAINNNRDRASLSGTSRFLVKLEGSPLCAVKKLPRNGPYNLEHVLELQSALHDGAILPVPKILGVYLSGEEAYIAEEYIKGDNLVHLFQKGEISLQQVVSIISDFYNRLLMVDLDQSELPAYKEQKLQSILDTLDMLELEAGIKESLRKNIVDNCDELFKKVCYTNGDLVPQNIIQNNTSMYLVDFDLTRRTCASWIELIRMVRYSSYSGIDIGVDDFASFMPSGAPIKFLTAVMYLNEMGLQRQILDSAYFRQHQASLNSEFIEVIKALYNDEISNKVILKENIINKSNDNKDKADLNEFVQIYWTVQANDCYDESNSLKSAIRKDEWAIYEFELNVKQLSSLRLDPMNYSGVVEISRFEISELESNLVHLVRYEQVDIRGMEGYWHDRIYGISLGTDPQLVIQDLDLKGTIKVTVEMRISTTGQFLLEEIKGVLIEREEAVAAASKLRDKESELLSELEQLNVRMSVHIEQSNRELEQYRSELTRLSDENRELGAEVTRLSNDLRTLLSSRSWRLSKPIRIAGRFAKKVKGILRRTRKKLMIGRRVELVPVHQLEALQDGKWKSLGIDPYFEWRKPLLGGWVRIRFEGSAEQVAPLKLYFDSGGGYSESHSVEFGKLSPTSSGSSAIVKLPQHATVLRLDVGELAQEFRLDNFRARRLTRSELALRLAVKYFKMNGMNAKTVRNLISKSSSIVRTKGLSGLFEKTEHWTKKTNLEEASDYKAFLERESAQAETISSQRETIKSFSYSPLISVLVPVYNVDEEWLTLCIESVRNQVYENWELCIVDDCSTKPHIRPMLEAYQRKDSRIKVRFRETNGHISRSSNDAFELAAGEYVALLDHDDELTKDALYENVKLLNRYPETDIIYSDEDKITIKGERHSPFFKPDWSPDLFLSQMYTCHLTVYRRTLVERVGGFRVGFEGSQDYDLMLRASELTDKIRHIPKVLYHWRSLPTSTALAGSTKNYTQISSLNALKEAVERRNLRATVHEIEDYANIYLLRYEPVGNPKVSIIIPTRNMASVLSACLNSVFEKTSYSNFEVIVIDNGSDDPENFRLYSGWKEKEPERFVVYSYDIPFNYSKINNYGVNKARGELILLLNNDVEVITPEWLTEMAGQAIRPEVGAVGACLYYPDNTIQHGGVVLGIGGVAGHSHKYFAADQTGYFSRLKIVSNYSAVTAACLMIKKEVYLAVGGLDESLQVAFNDVDFCLKVREKRLYNIWLPHVQLYHYESKSRGHEDTPEKQARFRGEVDRMMEKWGRLLETDPFYNPNLTLTREDFSLGNPYQADEGRSS